MDNSFVLKKRKGICETNLLNKKCVVVRLRCAVY